MNSKRLSQLLYIKLTAITVVILLGLYFIPVKTLAVLTLAGIGFSILAIPLVMVWIRDKFFNNKSGE